MSKYPRLAYLKSGKGRFCFDKNRELKVESGLIFLLNAGYRSIEFNRQVPLIYLYMSLNIPNLKINGDYELFPPSHPNYPLLKEIMEDLLKENPVSIEREVLLAIDIIQSGQKEDRKLPEVIKSVLKRIHEDPCKAFVISELIRGHKISLSHFRRIFHQYLSCSPKQYVLQQRMKYAYKLLSETGVQVQEVARIMNYNNVFEFSRQFKKYFRFSPKYLKNI